jgi:hypothetical protein
MTYRFILGALALIFVSNMAVAGVNNDVPSCYAANKIQPFGAPYDKMVYVLIDQTVQLDSSLQKSVLDNMLRVLQPGTRFVVAEFSAFSQGRYLSVVHSGVIEAPIPQDKLGNVVMSRLSSFETCIKNQKGYAQNLALKSAYEAMSQSTSSLDHSDILMALKTVSDSIAQDPAKQKIILMVTDGLENSSLTSFYANHGLRQINPATEITKIGNDDMFANFGGARVYVLGGALFTVVGHKPEASYRSPQKLVALKRFWQDYFSKSDARLIEFGEPALVMPVEFGDQ